MLPTIGANRTRAVLSLLVALMLAIAVTGCGSDSDDNPPAGGDQGASESTGGDEDETGNYGYEADIPRKNADGELLPPPVQIFGGTDSGKRVSKDTLVEIKSQKQLEQLRKEINEGQKQPAIFASTDFKTRQMTAIFLKPEKDGAQTQVVTIRQGKDKYIVTAKRVMAGAGCSGAGKKTYPYNIVETDKLKGKPVLEVESEQSPAC